MIIIMQSYTQKHYHLSSMVIIFKSNAQCGKSEKNGRKLKKNITKPYLFKPNSVLGSILTRNPNLEQKKVENKNSVLNQAKSFFANP